ncbi:MAG: FAD-dependent thymidylate synthase, partial [Desulfobacteraceae bacterium]|nr:FAD-dependent thymidylate synthase [Desulfobacteraceae bacterium]
MRIVPSSFEVLDYLDQQSPAIRIEACGRVCYKSEDRISETSAGPFIRSIVKHGHNSVMEMAAVTLRVTVDTESIAAQFVNTLP